MCSKLTKEWCSIVFLIALMSVMIVLVNPIGNFPLADDWSFGYTVKHLVEDGKIMFMDWLKMTLIAQAFWGAFFSTPWGFSFTALRFSTLTLSMIGVIATFTYLHSLKKDYRFALFGATLLATNPLYFSISNTFMTDIPFYSCSILSIGLLIKGIKKENTTAWIFGMLFALLATFIRQFGIVIFISFAFIQFLKTGMTRKSLLWGLLPLILIIGLLLGYQHWIKSFNPSSDYNIGLSDFFVTWQKKPLYPFYSLALNGALTLIYTGLYLFPFLLFAAPNKWKASSISVRCLFVLLPLSFLILGFGYLLHRDIFLPFYNNFLYNTGIGPLELRDTWILHLPHYPKAPKILWQILTAIAFIGAGILCFYLLSGMMKIFQNFKKREHDESLNFIFLNAVLYFLLIGSGIIFLFDRYYIFFFPLFMGIILDDLTLVSKQKLRCTELAAAFLLIFYTYFTVTGSHDYLAWNRARWKALDDLMQKDHISPHQIDGGFEFNGWYLYQEKMPPSPAGKSSWWVDDDEYVVTFGPLLDYEIYKTYLYSRWMIPSGEGKIFVLRRHPMPQKLEPDLNP